MACVRSLIMLAASAVLAACAPTYGFQNSLAGNRLRAEFCDSVRDFVRAPLDENGLRRAWFLPMGVYEDGSIDFYKPMASRPRDDASSKFYRQRVGQLTHYTSADEFGFELSKCLVSSQGFKRHVREIDKENNLMRGSFSDETHNRQIEIRAIEGVTSILVAHEHWSGDLAIALEHPACVTK